MLIADDLRDFRKLLRISLESARFEVVGEAADGRRAVDLVRSSRPDVVVLDLSMPEMDGFQAIPHIKIDSPLTKVLVLSALDGKAVKDDARRAGADLYLEKGTDLAEVAAALQVLCT